jgi:Tetracyclin repressor-like, C-terminal domain
MSAMEQDVDARRLDNVDGVDADDAVCSWTTVYSYTVGFVIEELAVYPRPGERDKRYDPSSVLGGSMQRSSPLRSPLANTAFGNFDERFENGLQMILSGRKQSLRRK